jgi:predicted O-methyltransferase YrrM
MTTLDTNEVARAASDYTDFKKLFKRFGGSARTKHVSRLFPLRLKHVRYPIPLTSGIPKGFIRLCPWEVEYLFALARRAKVGILEVGRFNGGSAFVMSCANPRVPIHSIDIAPQNDGLLRKMFEQHGVGKNVHLIVGDSQHTRYDQIKSADLVFIDGDHSYAGCTADIVNWFDIVTPGGHVLFHDSYLGNPVQDAVQDFIDSRNDVEVVISPLMGKRHWRSPTGSFACIRRRKV